MADLLTKQAMQQHFGVIPPELERELGCMGVIAQVMFLSNRLNIDYDAALLKTKETPVIEQFDNLMTVGALNKSINEMAL